MLMYELFQLDYKLEEPLYLQKLCEVLSKHLKLETVYLEVQPQLYYELPYSYKYKNGGFTKCHCTDKTSSALSTYIESFSYRKGSLTVKLYNQISEPDKLTQILNHMITYFTLGKGVHDAHIDELTGVRNRTYLSHQLADIQTLQGLIVLDIDNFKQINDNHGHLTGDSVLEILGGLLIRVCGTEYTPYRYGGDEFVVVPEKIVTEDQLLNIAQSICESFSNTEIAKTYKTSLSVGVYHENRFKSNTVAQCTDIADRALYISKYLGKNRVTLATPAKMLFYDSRFKLRDLWLSLDRTDVNNSIILIKCKSLEDTAKVYETFVSRVRKLDIVTQFENGIFMVFDNEVTPTTFNHKYTDILEEYDISCYYVDLKQALNYYKLINILERKLEDEK